MCMYRFTAVSIQLTEKLKSSRYVLQWRTVRRHYSAGKKNVVQMVPTLGGDPRNVISPHFLRDDQDIKMLDDFKRRHGLSLPQNVLYKWMSMYFFWHFSTPNVNDSNS